MWIVCVNCLFRRMLSRLFSRLIHTRTLGKTKNLLFHLASGVGHNLLQTCLAFTSRKLPTVGTGQIVLHP